MNPEIIIIAAVAKDRAIGRKGDLLWHLPGDLRHFKSLTSGSTVIMGRLTWESLPKRPLPGRRNIIISSNPAFPALEAEVYNSLQSALEAASKAKEENPDENPTSTHPESDQENGSKKIFIIGGGSLYAQAIPFAHKLELTEIEETAPDADTWFPQISPKDWSLSASESFCEKGLQYSFKTYIRHPKK